MKRNKKIWWWISYNKSTMTLHLGTRKHCIFLQCPFASWWKARKYFKRPKFKFYFGSMWKYKGKVKTELGEYDDYEYKGGYWPAVSTEWLKWNTFKWLPIYIYSSDICWKDKWNTPRYEYPGYFIIYFGRSYRKNWQIGFSVTAPDTFNNHDCTERDLDDMYWESILWYLWYSKEYGMEDYKQTDIIKARNSYRDSNWTKTIDIPIKSNVEIVNIIEEKLFDDLYYAVRVKSEEVKSFCESYPVFSQKEISFRGYKDNEQVCYFKSTYAKYKWNSEYIELWIRKDKCLNDNPTILKECDYFDVECHKEIDLGPTFKDEFLTKRAIKLIRDDKISKDKCN